MGNLATPQALLQRWDEVSQDPSLQNLPYKIELNAWGKVEMSPASVRHGRLQAAVVEELKRVLRDGISIVECPVLTDIGIRVPDVAWASNGFMHQHGAISPLARAPEICVEVVSPSNVGDELSEKARAYLAAGAREVWLVAEDGSLRIVDASGERPQSALAGGVRLPDLTKEYR